MSRRKIKDPDRKKKVSIPAKKLDPKAMLALRRRAKRELDELKVYQRVHDGELDLLQRFDLVYMRQEAEELGWSRGLLEAVVERIWDEARRELNAEKSDDNGDYKD